ncbi:MAG: hypothetical protein JWM40_1133 [Frankiales bacterium]|nr:hypothetical protein [Frankiales bacterium]
MRKSFSLSLVGIVALAALIGYLALMLPAQREEQHRKQAASAQLALARVDLPVAFVHHDDSGKRQQVCADSPQQRCLLAPGDPQANVAAVKAALKPLTTGTVTSVCESSNPLPHSPVSCSVTTTVRGGGTLVVQLFAHPVAISIPVFGRTYSGSYVQVHVG